jgi:hypothetical protein
MGQPVRGWVLGIGIVVALATGVYFVSAAPPADAGGQRVVCITEFDGTSAYGAYKRRPRKCLIHERGKPFAWANMLSLKKLRWSYWGGQARGKGIASGTMFKAKARVKLTKPRSPCGATVYTVARIRYHGDSKGHFKVHLDNCLR